MKKLFTIPAFIGTAAVALALGLILHEGSHALTALVLGGRLTTASYGGTTASVGGYIHYKAIPWVAMAALVLPALLSFALSFVKTMKRTGAETWYAAFVALLTMNPLIGNIMNLGAAFVVTENRDTWDLLHAMDTVPAAGAVICVAASVASLSVASYAVYRCAVRIWKA